MSSDLQRFLRAVKVLATLAHKYRDDAWIEDLGRYATVQQEGDVWFVGTFLEDIGRELDHRRGDVDPKCRECGNQIRDNVKYNDRDPRGDARYCSAKCRQKAYRKRVTAGIAKPSNNHNGIAVSLRLASEDRDLPVTGSRQWSDLDIPDFLQVKNRNLPPSDLKEKETLAS